MYLVWINPPINFAFSDDSVFLKKILGGGHKFYEFACFQIVSLFHSQVLSCVSNLCTQIRYTWKHSVIKKDTYFERKGDS